MPPAAIIGGAIVAGGALSYFGAQSQANAQQNIAQAQLSAQQMQQQQALQYAQMTPQEMQMMGEQISFLGQQNAVFGQNIANSSATLSAINPMFVNAGQQANALMNGQSAPTLAPLQAQIQQQRETLQTQLSQMYGSGWQSSSAGIEAMQRFEQGAQSTISQAQQSYMGTLMGTATQGANISNQAMNQNASTMSNMFTQAQGSAQDYNKMAIGALTGFSTTQYQGANNVGANAMGGWMSSMGNGVMQGGMSAGMMGMMSGSANPTTASAGTGGAAPASASPYSLGVPMNMSASSSPYGYGSSSFGSAAA